MLVTFSCDAHASITMFGEVALRLIKMMGHSGTVPSAILANDVPSALMQLESAIEREKQKPTAPICKKLSEDDDDDRQEVSIEHRALPLVALLQDATKQKCDVMWK